MKTPKAITNVSNVLCSQGENRNIFHLYFSNGSKKYLVTLSYRNNDKKKNPIVTSLCDSTYWQDHHQQQQQQTKKKSTMSSAINQMIRWTSWPLITNLHENLMLPYYILWIKSFRPFIYHPKSYIKLHIPSDPSVYI